MLVKLQFLWRGAEIRSSVQLVRNWKTREPFDLRERAGIRVCEALARRGVLTRSIGNVIVLMPPYCTTPKQGHKMVSALEAAIREVFGLNSRGRAVRAPIMK